MKWNKRCAGAALACGLLAGSTVAATPAAAQTLDCTMCALDARVSGLQPRPCWQGAG